MARRLFTVSSQIRRHTAQQAFQLLGEMSLTDPNPNPFVEFWTFSHPSVTSRAAFAAKYNPWASGQHPKYFAQMKGALKTRR